MDEGKEQDVFTLSDLEDFFQPEEGTEEEVSTLQIARITEKALRGPKSKKTMRSYMSKKLCFIYSSINYCRHHKRYNQCKSFNTPFACC